MSALSSAEVHTLLWNRGTVHPEIESRVRQTSFLQRLPRSADRLPHYLPLFPAAVRSLSIQDVDLVISSSHAVAKGSVCPPTSPRQLHLHADALPVGRHRQLLSFWKTPSPKRLALALVAPYLRRFDLKTASSVDHFVAISGTSAVESKECTGSMQP